MKDLLGAFVSLAFGHRGGLLSNRTRLSLISRRVLYISERPIATRRLVVSAPIVAAAMSPSIIAWLWLFGPKSVIPNASPAIVAGLRLSNLPGVTCN